MAPMNQSVQSSGHHDTIRQANLPPPSSILATHFGSNSTSLPTFDHESFKLLLDESLGVDENGNSNLDADVSVNHKLICLIVRAALDDLFEDKDNPFRSQASGRTIEQAARCLDAIRLAVERTPQVLYVKSKLDDVSGDESVPLFLWLLLKILPLICVLGGNRRTLTEKGVGVLSAALATDYSCSIAGSVCELIWNFISSCAEVILDQLETTSQQGLTDILVTLNHSTDNFTQRMASLCIDTSNFYSKIDIGSKNRSLNVVYQLLSIMSRSILSLVVRNKSMARRHLHRALTQFERLWAVLLEPGFREDTFDEDSLSLIPEAFLLLQELNAVTNHPHMKSFQQRFCLIWASAFVDCFAVRVEVKDIHLHVEILKRVLSASSVAAKEIPELKLRLIEILPAHVEDLLKGDYFVGMQSDLHTILVDLSTIKETTLDSSQKGPQDAEEDWPSDRRPRKRLRLSTDEQSSEPLTWKQRLCLRLTLKLSGAASSDLDGLSESSRWANTAIFFTFLKANTQGRLRFREMSDLDQCAAVSLLGRAACSFSESGDPDNGLESYEVTNCSICDRGMKDVDRTSVSHFDPNGELIKTLLAFAPSVGRVSKARVEVTLAFRRLLMHTSTPELLDLGHSAPGDWCLQSLRSSSRDTRMASTQTLKAFLMHRGDVDTKVIHNNRVVALDYLQALWVKGEATTQEATILALTSMAEVVEDEEVNIILVRLVEYLGHRNLYIAGLVNTEMQRLAQVSQLTLAALLRPFWRTLGVVVIKNLQTRPAIAQQLCDMLGMPVDGLLMLIEEYALPHLIIAKRQDDIQRIALAHGSTTTPFLLCTQRQNLSSILSFLLNQHYADPETTIMELLRSASEEFQEQDLATWIYHEPILIACELLKAAADAGEGHGARAHQALLLMAQLMSRKPGQQNGPKKAEIVGNFIENNALAIISHFTVMLNEIEAKQPNLEKRRCLAAMGEMMKLGKSRASVALPQICACLSSAMENRALCDTAFTSWAVMVSVLKGDDVKSLVDQTLAIIVQGWHLFDTETQQKAYDVVSNLLKKHTSLIREIYNTIPSLASIPLMSKFEGEISNLKRQMDERHQLMAFTTRLQSDNQAVIEQTLQELRTLMKEKAEFLTRSVLREQPDILIPELTRALLNCRVRFGTSTDVAALCGQCLGQIGCLDPNKVETIREKKSMVVTYNFSKADETIDFIFFFLEHVLVDVFLAATSTRAQGFVAWAMQSFLKICSLDDAISLRSKTATASNSRRRWIDLPESVRDILTPFLSSRYSVKEVRKPDPCQYPIFQPGQFTHTLWVKTIVLDMLYKGPGDNVQLVFDICCRIINGQDAAIPNFLLPFAAVNVVISGVEQEKQQLVEEMLHILRQPLEGDHKIQDDIKLCSESVFSILDYMSKWIQLRKKQHSNLSLKQELALPDALDSTLAQIRSVETVLESIPPDLLSQRAIECKSYARALFHWEQYMRQRRQKHESSDALLERLQEIYAQVDEPDGIEGVSSQLHILNIDQQVLEHRKAGRWTAAQNWYEIQLVDKPSNGDIQMDLLTCLKETGQFDAVLHHFDGLDTSESLSRLLPFAVEASWVTNQWDKLSFYLTSPEARSGNFNLDMGMILQALQQHRSNEANSIVERLYRSVASELTANSTTSLQACHDSMLKLHALTDVSSIIDCRDDRTQEVMNSLNQRLDELGTYVTDKQYLLGIHRAAMAVHPSFSKRDVASAWLASARLARKVGATNQAFNAILHASVNGETSATIEQAKLMWKEGHHRKAIQTLEGAINSSAFISPDNRSDGVSMTINSEAQLQPNEVMAKAYVLLGRWLDAAGQTQSEVIIKTFRKATNHHQKWERGWYHLGKHYNKILDSEKTKPPGKENQTYLTGEAYKVVIDNFLRSMTCGSKYVFHTLPKVLTLWLELTSNSEQPQDTRRGNERFHIHTAAQRKKVVDETNAQIKKYIDRLHPSVLYTILPQVVARICHPSQVIYNLLVAMVVKVIRAYPQQALWTLLAVVKSRSADRSTRGLAIISKAIEVQKKLPPKDISAADLQRLIATGQKFCDEILRIAEFPIEGRTARVNLGRDLGFNHKIAPSKLVVPVEACLIPSIPTSYEAAHLKTFRSFPKEAVTIAAFLDEALVLSSLQKPRKLSIRGSDGKIYGMLAKPKDDMRKDQRLMEFNSMINRFLKHDVEASKRRLYIRTYAVVPLNEECGLIEWVDNLKTFRDIVMNLYKERGVTIDFGEMKTVLAQASSGEPEKVALFDKILARIPPVFHDWFVDTFPDPSAWFNARLRFTRSAAVMSMVGHVLGLGDRHGENMLFEEDNGGTLHVDFNCLFDKGLTFDKPECVPFRLTHNMVDAMGAYGYDGPFRRCCEITLQLLRANDEGLMTILETFLYDPTTDFISSTAAAAAAATTTTAGSKLHQLQQHQQQKKKREGVLVNGVLLTVPDTVAGVLDNVRTKVKGLLPGESVPLSVGGYVEEMIKRATDPTNLCRMYIGWCAFL